VLSARAEADPILVAFGRTSGSARAPLAANVTKRPETQVAGADDAQPGRPKTLSVNGAIPVAASAFAPARTAGPMKLQGSSAATPVALRPGAAAGIRPKANASAPEKAVAPKAQTPTKTPTPKAQTARAVDGKPKPAQASAKPAAQAKQKTAAAKPAPAKPAAARPAPAKPVLAKPAAPKPADD
jgi:D-alanyl-D-alanine carboxypeptidase